MTPKDPLFVGNAYYRLGFVDRQGVVVDIQTLIYIGKNVVDDDANTWYFQDPGSFAQHGSFVDAGTDACTVYALTEMELNSIVDFHELRAELNKLG
jgi:hypothetical protein